MLTVRTVNDKVFSVCVLVSLALHFLLLMNLPALKRQAFARPEPLLEVYFSRYKELSQKELKYPRALSEEDFHNPAPQDKPSPRAQEPNETEKKPIPAAEVLLPGKKEARPVTTGSDGVRVVHLDRLSEAVQFVDYYTVLRQRIRKAMVYPSGDSWRYVQGVAKVSFCIDSRGRLKQVFLKTSSGEPCLDRAALEGIKNAVPFPPFPVGLKEDTILLNVDLVFKVE